MFCNEALLSVTGGSWCYPPAGRRWIEESGAVDLLGDARQAFLSVHPAAPWVCKDPRLCITLPFWLRAIGDDEIAAVLPIRHPVEVAQSLTTRGGIDWETSLALWERSMLSALGALSGRPVLVTTYDELVDAPRAWWGKAAAFLRSLGAPAPETPTDDVFGFLDAELRHHRVHASSELRVEQRRLWELCRDLVGPHPALAVGDLPAESTATTETLERGRSAEATSWVSRAPLEELPAPARPLIEAARRIGEQTRATG